MLAFSPSSPADTNRVYTLVRRGESRGRQLSPGEAREDNDNRGGSPAASQILGPDMVDTALYAAVEYQDAGCDLSKNGKSSRRVSFRLPGSDGSNYLRPPLSVNLTSLCTNPVIRNHATRFGRPERSNDRNRPLIVARFRSGKDVPSIQVSVSRQTTVGVCTPPSADQPKLKTLAQEISSARAVSGTRPMRYRRIWCYPGKGTPSSSRVSLAHDKGKCVGSLGKFDLRSQVDHEIQDFKSEKDSVNLGSQVDQVIQNVNRLSSFDLGSSRDRVSQSQLRLSRLNESLDELTLAPQEDSTAVNSSNRNSAFHIC